MPPFGAYASEVEVDGKIYKGISNIGIKPTVGSDKVLIETWMPEYSGRELYGERLKISFDSFIRPEMKFNSLDELKKAILNDKAAIYGS